MNVFGFKRPHLSYIAFCKVRADLPIEAVQFAYPDWVVSPVDPDVPVRSESFIQRDLMNAFHESSVARRDYFFNKFESQFS